MQSLWIKVRYVDCEWVNLENVDAHLKVSSASEAVFWSSISWQRCSCVGGKEEDDEEKEQCGWKCKQNFRKHA
jgi:hypothetical protein